MQHIIDAWINGSHIDLVIKVDQKTFEVHRLVMEASDFLSACMKHAAKEAPLGCITLQDVDAELFAVVLEYMYTGHVSVLPDELCGMLQLACRLQLHTLIDAAASMLIHTLHEDNVLCVWDLVGRLQLPSLHRVADAAAKWCSDRLLVVQGQVVRDANISKMTSILNLGAPFCSASFVLDTIFQWALRHRPPPGQVRTLLRKVQFASVPASDMLYLMRNNPFLNFGSGNADIVAEALLSPRTYDGQHDMPHRGTTTDVQYRWRLDEASQLLSSSCPAMIASPEFEAGALRWQLRVKPSTDGNIGIYLASLNAARSPVTVSGFIITAGGSRMGSVSKHYPACVFKPADVEEGDRGLFEIAACGWSDFFPDAGAMRRLVDPDDTLPVSVVVSYAAAAAYN